MYIDGDEYVECPYCNHTHDSKPEYITDSEYFVTCKRCGGIFEVETETVIIHKSNPIEIKGCLDCGEHMILITGTDLCEKCYVKSVADEHLRTLAIIMEGFEIGYSSN